MLKLVHGSTPQDVADKTSRSVAEVVKITFSLGEMATASQSLSDDALGLLAAELGYEAEIVGVEEEEEPEEEIDESRLEPRAPVVTIMGHVDHGKTLLLDAIRQTDVVSQEFGGITQHIGAYQVHTNGREVTFIDTPGHEAFTAMRARGAQVTDIAVLVVAADDGVKPQTIEALDHAKAAGVQVLVAVNKIDKPEADPTRVRQQLVEQGLVPAEWGGTVEFVDVSAKARTNLDNLLDTILLVADLEELKGDPVGRARGVVLEAHLDKGRGPVASVLVQRGTLDVGDTVVSGTSWAKIRAMLDENGQQVKQAGPSKPVQILGWSATPNAGDDIREVEDERAARHVVQEREAKVRAAEMVSTRPPTLQELMARAERDEVPELNLIVKADVQGSIGALVDALAKLPQDEVRVNVIRSAAGAITESDINLALTSRAIVVGFNVRPDVQARDLAEKEGVDVRLYRVIYDAIDDIRSALGGMLKPEQRETQLGRAEVRAAVPRPEGRPGRRLVRPGGHDHPQRAGPRHPRRRRRVRRPDRLAPPLQGRRPRGERGVRVRHRDRELQRRQGRRHHRGVRGPRGRPRAVGIPSMLVALERFDLRIPACGSLKEKRHVVKTLTSGIRSTFNVSVAEVDHHDLWQRTAIAVAAVAGEQYHARRVLHEVEKLVDRWGEVELIDRELTLHYPEA